VTDTDKLERIATWEGWFWNGRPHDARPITGVLVARGVDQPPGEPLAIGGTEPMNNEAVWLSGLCAPRTRRGEIL
jgi:hypothetical protein